MQQGSFAEMAWFPTRRQPVWIVAHNFPTVCLFTPLILKAQGPEGGGIRPTESEMRDQLSASVEEAATRVQLVIRSFNYCSS